MDEFKNYMNACAKNMATEVLHLKEFLKDKDESYILSNPEEVAFEVITSGRVIEMEIGAYYALDGIRESGMVPKLRIKE